MPIIATATGAQLDYEDTGSGARGTVVALHGMLGTGRKDLGTVIDWLSDAGYRVLAPTLRGYGASQPKPRDFPPDFYHRDARDVLAFMDALGIDRAHILGYSDGGEITLVIGGSAPDRAETLTAWGAVGYFGADMRAVAQRMYPPTWLGDDELTLHALPSAEAFVLGWIGAVTHMIDAGGDVSLSLAPHITAPLLLMLGDADTLNPVTYGQRFVDQVRDGRLEVLACGHPVHTEQRAAFERLVGAHLARG